MLIQRVLRLDIKQILIKSEIIMTTDTFKISMVLIFAAASSSCSKLGTLRPPARKLIIDTDAGGDDAIAILMAIGAEELDNDVKIIGITCVNGNADVETVVLNVLKTLKAAKRLDIPVYKGASHPLLSINERDYYFGRDGFGDFHYPNSPSMHLARKTHAVIAMIDMVKAHRGKVTILALGPLTNIALAIRMYPSFLGDLKELIIMGGSTEGRGNVRPGIEFNFFTDPGANYVVFNSSTSKPAILVSWETSVRTRVTTEFRMSLSKCSNAKVWLINSAESLSLNPNAEYWNSPDAVAAAVALTSGSIVIKSGIYYSETVYAGSQMSGMIIVDYTNITGNPANTHLIQGIRVEDYKKLLTKYFCS